MQIRPVYLTLPLLLASGQAFAQATDPRPPLEVTVTRPAVEEGVPGVAATTVTAAEITRSPAQSLPALLAQEPGVQYRDLFGGPGARAYIDLRGFGAVATQNTLMLLNGRRLNDIDNAGVEFINVPPDNIRRIEILRGNSAAVLYGDGAVGGAVNVITRPGVGANGTGAKVGVGSFGLREGRVSLARSGRTASVAVDGNVQTADGWRQNNELDQRGVALEARHFGAGQELYGTFAVDEQHLGLPGARKINLGTGQDQVRDDPRGATTPTDFVDQTGYRTVLGYSRLLAGGAELVLDGGIRVKAQDSVVISAFGPANDTTTNTRIATYSLTPRVRWEEGTHNNTIFGLDYYYSDYNQIARQGAGAVPTHRYDLKQHSLALYGQATRPLNAATAGSFGLRAQQVQFIGGDILDPNATIAFGGVPFDGHRESVHLNDTQWAGHLGLDHDVSRDLTIFGRVGRAFRLPTVDERILSSPTYDSFGLNVQTSWDIEAGARWRVGSTLLRASAFRMDLSNEIHFNPGTFLNENLDPTRRRGVELGAEIAFAPTLVLDLGLTWTRATFRAGANEGNELPLVSKWTGAASLRWDFRPSWSLTSTLSGVGARYKENDDGNVGTKIPAHSIVDMKVSTQQGSWSFAGTINNVFDADYYNYAVQSTTDARIWNAYPLPGRTWKLEAGLRF